MVKTNDKKTTATKNSISGRKRRHGRQMERLAWPTEPINGGAALGFNNNWHHDDNTKSSILAHSSIPDEKLDESIITKTKKSNHSISPRGTIRKTSSSRKHNNKKQSQVLEDRQQRKKKTTGEEDKSLWVEKYKPKNVKDLCIAPKKVKEVRSWIIQEPPTESKLLILVGSPGIGKSTLIHTLAEHDLNYNILEWDESYTQGDEISPLRSFESFLCNAGTFGSTTLSLETRECKPQNNDESKSTSTTLESFFATTRSSRRKKQVSKNKKVTQQEKKSTGGDKGSIILIDEVPNLHTPIASERFRNIMTEHIESTHVRTVMIFSNVSEGQHNPEDLEVYIEPQILYSPLVQIMSINPVTKAKLKSCLNRIIKAESSTIVSSSCLNFEELHTLSGGDMRHVIMMTQFQIGASDECVSSSPTTIITANSQKHLERDKKLSIFHALGKLLYAKRLPAVTKTNNSIDIVYGECTEENKVQSRPPLEYIPEKVMEESDIQIDGAVSFLSYNCPDFFTDVSELSEAFDHFSDAALFLDQKYGGSRDSVYPLGYASSLAGRAVADANKHPAPSKFRQFSAPKMFEVARKRRDVAINMFHLRRNLSKKGYKSINGTLGSSASFVMNDFSMIKRILPVVVSNVQGNSFQEIDIEPIRSPDLDNEADFLVNDDIVDSDDDENIVMHKSTEADKNNILSSIGKQSPEVIIID